ncbi:MAG: papain-like cysteine protease family protein [Parcubacteria group bacterium]
MKKFFQSTVFFSVLVVSSLALGESFTLQRVPFVAQTLPGDWTRSRNSGLAVVAMLAGYELSFQPTSDDVRKIVRWMYDRQSLLRQAGADYFDGNAMTLSQLETILNEFYQLRASFWHYGYPESNRAFIRSLLRTGQPLVVSVTERMNQFGATHYVLVVGATNDEVIVHDPGSATGGFRHYSWERFENAWAMSNFASLSLANLQVNWHPDGTLVQNGVEDEVYLISDGLRWRIPNDSVFESNGFDERKVIHVSRQELDCFDIGGVVERRRLESFQSDGNLYLAVWTADEPDCVIYSFANETSFRSWKQSWPPREIDRRVAEEAYFHQCSDGGTLYVRPGSLVRPLFRLPDFGEDSVFVSTGNGILRPFENNAVSLAMGYGNAPVLYVQSADFFRSFMCYGNVLTMLEAQQCSWHGEAMVAGELDGGLQSPLEKRRQPKFLPRKPMRLSLRQIEGGVSTIDGGVSEEDGGVASVSNDPKYETVNCRVVCPAHMASFIWYGTSGQIRGSPVAELHSTMAEICQRGRPWIDFNCACTSPYDWACHDRTLAQITCNHSFDQIEGVVDPRGEGEVWFTDFSCY